MGKVKAKSWAREKTRKERVNSGIRTRWGDTSGQRVESEAQAESSSQRANSESSELTALWVDLSSQESGMEGREEEHDKMQKRKRGRPKGGQNNKNETKAESKLIDYWKEEAFSTKGGLSRTPVKILNIGKDNKGVEASDLDSQISGRIEKEETERSATREAEDINKEEGQSEREERRDWEIRFEEKWDARMAEVERLIRVEFAKIKVSKQECERCGTKEAQAERGKNEKKLEEENERYRKEIQKLENMINNQEEQLVCLRKVAKTDRVSRRAGQQTVTNEPSGIERAGQQMVRKEPSDIETGMNRKRGTPTSQKEAQQVPKDNSTGGTQDSGDVAADQMGDVSAGARNLEMDNRVFEPDLRMWFFVLWVG